MQKALILASFAVLAWSSTAGAQTNSSVTVDQISRPRVSAAPIPAPVSSSSREAKTDIAKRAETPSGPTEQEVEACRIAAVRGARIEGTECSRILAQRPAEQAQASGEGALLQLYGQRANITTPEEARSTVNVNADDVARSNGSAQGNTAQVVATIRNNPPPSAPPR